MIPRMCVVALILTTHWGNCLAAEDEFFDEVEVEPKPSDGQSDEAIAYSGKINHRLHYAVTDQKEELPFRREDTGPASIRYDILLEARYKAENNLTLKLAGLASYDAELEDPSYVEVDESYIEWGATPSLNIKVGRQLVSLGESNYFQIADRINPIDERAFGLAELSETLLPIAATRFSYYKSRWGVDLIALHEFRRNLYDEPYGDFDPYIEFRDPAVDIRDPSPDVSLADSDLLGRLFLSEPWGDWGLFLSRLHSREARPVEADADTLNMAYPEMTVIGVSANRVLGSWLLKGEYAHVDGDRFLLEDSDAIYTQALSEEGRLNQLMIGGRYSGMSNLTLDVELLTSHIDSTGGPLGEERTQVTGVASMEYEMLNDNLVANITYMGWARKSASMLRFRLDYTFRDEIVLYFGAINYSANTEEAMLAPYQNNDRMFTGVTISF